MADVYTGKFEASSAMDDPTFNSPNHKANPLYVFRLASNGFKIQGGCSLQNDPENYEDGTSNVFPDESRIYRLMPTDLMPDRFFYKYLPDYFFTRVKMPDAVIHEMETDMETGESVFDITIPVSYTHLTLPTKRIV